MEWKLELDRELKLALQLAQEALAKILQLAFSGELAPDWHKSDTLVKTVPNKLAGIWYVNQQTASVMFRCLTHSNKGEMVD
jgi:hypothetical protein